jgi:hypothetical protein
MRYVALLALAVLAVTCGPSPDAKLPGWAASSSGASGEGGITSTGGTTRVGAGGTTLTGSGGSTVAGSGGRTVGSGGVAGGGGADTGGQITGSGGRTTAPDAGGDLRPPRDTASGTGGTSGSGGTTAAGSGGIIYRDAGAGGTVGRDAGTTSTGGTVGRDAGTDARVGTGGISGTGGATVPRDAAIPPSDVASSCYATIVNNGYKCGSAPACSACIVNNVSKEAECKKGLDCLAAAGPSCDSNCQLNCLNQAGDAQVGACIKALTTPACSGSGC